MYCRHCGKELSDEAFMCPDCGTPTGVDFAKKKIQKETPETEAGGINMTALSVVAFILSMFAFVTGIIFGAFCYEYVGAALLLYVLGATTILPALVGLSIGAYVLCKRNLLSTNAKNFAIVAVVFASIVLLVLFLTACLIVTEALF